MHIEDINLKDLADIRHTIDILVMDHETDLAASFDNVRYYLTDILNLGKEEMKEEELKWNENIKRNVHVQVQQEILRRHGINIDEDTIRILIELL